MSGGTGGYRVAIVGNGESVFQVKVADNETDFLNTTVMQLKEKIFNTKSDVADSPEYIRLLFAGKQLEDHYNLRHYNILKGSTISVVQRAPGGSNEPSVERVPVPPKSTIPKEYPVSGFAMRFTSDEDCIDPYADSERRVKMKCGHAVDPNTLTDYCRSQLNQHIFRITCPAIISYEKGKPKICNREWDYADVRTAALLTEAEMNYFETKMSEYASAQYCDVKECPGCKSYIERRDLTNLRVTCIQCTKRRGCTYDFCWQCMKEWTCPPTTSAVKCGSPSCVHIDLPLIRDAVLITLNGVQVPNRRACPTCGKVIEHTAEKCKMVICHQCKKEFCFLCLELSSVCLSNTPLGWYKTCSKPVAPKQTEIPVWSR